ncbi:MAG: ribosome maturation factor RimM [Bdellovibrionota bacterium]
MMKVVGKIKEAHGIKGELKVLIFSKDFSWVSDLETFEIQSPTGQKKTFEVEKVRISTDIVIMAAKGLKDRNEAELYRGWSFAVPETLFVSKPGETIFLIEVLNFHVVDMEGNDLGEITGFGSNGQQDLLQVKQGEHTFEIPFVDPFIQKISFDNKTVQMDLPEGLFDPDLVGGKKA